MLNHYIVLGFCISLLFPLCRAVRCDWPAFFFCLHRRLETGAECCWVLLCVWAPETKSNIPAILWWTSVLQGDRGDGFYPHQPCSRRAERVSENLRTCNGRILISNCVFLYFCYPATAAWTTPHFLIWSSGFAVYRSASKLVSLAQALPLFIHILHEKNKKRWCLCTRDATRAHAVVKMEAKRKCRGGGGVESWPYLASADNASRRCKWDKWSLSWWLDVARWWFAVNLTAFAVWPLPSRRCYCESGEHESERKREMNSYYIPQCIASPWPVLKWSHCVGLPQWHVSNRKTRR